MKLIKKVKKLLYKIKYKKFGTPDGGKRKPLTKDSPTNQQWGGGG